METIALYSNQIAQMSGKLGEVKKTVGDYKSELFSLRTKALAIKQSICNMDVEELKDICIKYNITTVERLRHFLVQCLAETGNDKDLIENGSKSYLEKQNYYPYYGAGRIQITWKYEYQAFAIHQVLENCPQLSSKIKYPNPENNSPEIIENMYNKMVKYAKEKTLILKFIQI